MKLARGFGGFVLIVAIALLVATPTLADDKSDLAGRAAEWAASFNEGDDAAVAAQYTEDCMRLPYQAEAISGRDAVLASLKSSRDAGTTSAKIETIEGETHGDMAWGRGTYALMDADGNVIQSGKWLNVSIQVDGKWLIHRDIWNTDKPEE